MSNLDNTTDLLNKRYGKRAIVKASDLKAESIDRISTGSLSLDIELGGGLPCGRIVEIFGREGSGKTTIALKTVVEAQKRGKKCVWIDQEGAIDLNWAKTLGVDLDKLLLASPDNGEKGVDILEAYVRTGEVGVIVLDSIEALVPAADIETSAEDKERLGDRAKLCNRMARKLQAALNVKVGEGELLNDCIVILINQIREKIGVMYGSPETTPGGLGIKFYSSVRINLRAGEWLEDSASNKVGHEIKFKIKKNRTAPPMRTGAFTIYFDGERKGQIDRALEILNYSVLKGLIKLKGRTYNLYGKKVVGKGALLKYISEDDKIRAKLEKDINKVYLLGEFLNENSSSK